MWINIFEYIVSAVPAFWASWDSGAAHRFLDPEAINNYLESWFEVNKPKE